MKHVIPKVRRSDGLFVPWNREAIVASLLKETKLAEEFFGIPPISREEAEEIAKEVEKRIIKMELSFVSGPLIRELVNNILLEKSREKPHYRVYRNIYTRVGSPIHDAYLIDIGKGFEAKENANLQPNAETSHKKKADKLSKEEYLLLMPTHLADAHLSGDLHIHDLEYFGTRPFCQDWDLRYFFYYGFIPDGLGTRTSVAGPAKKPEVAVLHSVKVLAAAQTNFAGGEGFYNYLVFLAPYMEGLSFKRVKQLMQMMFFELSVDGEEDLIVENSGEVKVVKAGKYIDKIIGDKPDYVRGSSEIKYNPGFKVLCYDPITKRVEFREATAVMRHPINDDLYLIKTKSGRRVKVTGHHSVFTLDENGFLVPCKVKDLKPGDWIATIGKVSGEYEEDVDVLKYASENLDEKELLLLERAFSVKIKASEKDLAEESVPVGFFKDVSLKEELSRRPLVELETSGQQASSQITLGEKLSELLGYYVAMGWVLENHLEHGVYIEVEDPDVKERIVSLVKEVFEIEAQVQNSTVKFGDFAHALLFAKALNCGFAINDKQVPPILFKAPRKVKARFLYAYYTCKGFRYRGRIGFYALSEKIANGLILLLQSLHLRPLIIETPEMLETRSRRIIKIILAKRDSAKIAELIPELEQEVFSIDAPSKGWGYHIPLFETLRTALSEEGYLEALNPNVRSVPVETVKKYLGKKASKIGDLKPILEGEIVMDEIVEIEKVEPSSKYVYDVEVLGVENFTGGLGAILLHNTQMYVARGGQPVFSNIQVTPGVPELWRDIPVVYKGKVWENLTYGDFEDEVNTLFRALYTVALEGDYWGKPFNFPKLENGISPEFFNSHYDEEWLLVHEVVAKFGTPYFDNLIPPYRGYGKGVSCYQCCAYCFVETPESDPEFQEKLYFVDGKHFSMGSAQVVTLNLPRTAYKANGDDEKLLEEIFRLMDLCVEIFKVKKKWLDLMLKYNRIPFATQRPRDPRTGKRGPPAVDFKELVYTIGIVGANEMAQAHTGYQLHEHPEAVKFVIKVLLEMKKYLRELSERHSMKLALARTPAESAAQRLAVADLVNGKYSEKAREVVKGDLEKARKMLAMGEHDVPVYYSNGTHVYVGAPISLWDRIKIEHKFFPVLDGGNMFHVWLGEAHPDPEALYKLTEKICRNTQIGYFAYTKDLTICRDCNAVSPLVQRKCPVCGSTNVSWWSRVTGYYQEVNAWNKAKQEEFMDRYRVKIYE